MEYIHAWKPSAEVNNHEFDKFTLFLLVTLQRV